MKWFPLHTIVQEAPALICRAPSGVVLYLLSGVFITLFVNLITSAALPQERLLRREAAAFGKITIPSLSGRQGATVAVRAGQNKLAEAGYSGGSAGEGCSLTARAY